MRTSFSNFLSAEGAGLAFNIAYNRERNKVRSTDPRNEELPYASLFDQLTGHHRVRSKSLRKMVSRG